MLLNNKSLEQWEPAVSSNTLLTKKEFNQKTVQVFKTVICKTIRDAASEKFQQVCSGSPANNIKVG